MEVSQYLEGHNTHRLSRSSGRDRDKDMLASEIKILVKYFFLNLRWRTLLKCLVLEQLPMLLSSSLNKSLG